jgi:hypothetical protein
VLPVAARNFYTSPRPPLSARASMSANRIYILRSKELVGRDGVWKGVAVLSGNTHNKESADVQRSRIFERYESHTLEQ